MEQRSFPHRVLALLIGLFAALNIVTTILAAATQEALTTATLLVSAVVYGLLAVGAMGVYLREKWGMWLTSIVIGVLAGSLAFSLFAIGPQPALVAIGLYGRLAVYAGLIVVLFRNREHFTGET
ncbi:MAG: hypothetical protein GYB64_18315 [Chloroflexi bacterium]|nr:hypothetical protein [Chloroflexota bacterium]